MVTFVQIFLALLVCLFDNRHFSVQFWKSIDCRSLLTAAKCQFFINPFTFKQCRVCFGKLAWRKAGGLISESFSILKICGRSVADCKPALSKGRKYQMVKTQSESHVRRPVVWTNRWQIWVFFSFEFLPGTAGICHTSLWGFSEAL